MSDISYILLYFCLKYHSFENQENNLTAFCREDTQRVRREYPVSQEETAAIPAAGSRKGGYRPIHFGVDRKRLTRGGYERLSTGALCSRLRKGFATGRSG